MIVLDIESTGTDFQKHAIVSIGAIDFLEPTRTFYEECKIWEGAHIDGTALTVNGFGVEEVKRKDKKGEGEIVKNFIDWAMTASEHTIAGQNPFFDLFFIQVACQRAGLNFPLAHRIVDMHSVCYLHMIKRGMVPPVEKGRSNLNSDAIMEYVGLPTEPKPHNALNGAKWEAEAFSRLFYDKSLLPQFASYKIPWAR